MSLAAVDEELGACPFGITLEYLQPFWGEFGVPDRWDPNGGITVGYRVEDLPPQAPVSPSAGLGRATSSNGGSGGGTLVSEGGWSSAEQLRAGDDPTQFQHFATH